MLFIYTPVCIDIKLHTPSNDITLVHSWDVLGCLRYHDANSRRAISNTNAVSSVTTECDIHITHVTQYSYRVTAIKQTILKRGWEVGNPFDSFFVGG